MFLSPVTRKLLLVASVLCMLLAVAPSARSAPAPAEWERSAPGRQGASSAAAGPVLSKPVRTSRRFNLLGFNWRGRATARIHVRVREPGRPWAGWTAVPAEPDGGPDGGSFERTARRVSAPVWAGDARWVQYRLSRPLPHLRIHFVNTLRPASGQSPPSLGLAAVARRLPRARAAQAPQTPPPIVPRAAWGAERCAPRRSPAFGVVRSAVVHHTVTANEYTPQQAPAAVLAICRYHRNSNKWNDIGYNFLVDKYGTVYEGRAGGVANPVVGAHAQGTNAQTVGIANLGTYSGSVQSPAAMAAMARLIRWKLPLHGAPTAGTTTLTSAGGETARHQAGTPVVVGRVSGHRDVNLTSCPGDALFGQLSDLRGRVGSVTPVRPAPAAPVSGPPRRTRIDARVQPGVLRYGQRARVKGSLRLLAGAPVTGAPLEVQQYAAAGWQTVARTRSRGDGTFGIGVAAEVRRILRVRFPGDSGRGPSVSRRSVVLVKPSISVTGSVARASVGRAPVLTGRVDPAKGRLVLVVDRKAGRRYVRVARMVVRTRGGRLRKGYRLRSRGLYRFIAAFPGDRANLPAASAPAYVRALDARGGGASVP